MDIQARIDQAKSLTRNMASSFHGSALNPIKAGANNVMNYSSAVMTPRVNQSQVQDKTETSP